MYTEFKDQTTPAWDGFHGTQWRYEINVREFIQDNYLPYDGDESFLEKIKHYHTYRDSEPTTSILTITSNVVYGK